MPSSLDLWLIAALGFLGSFGHCVGMCGPVAAAFALGESGTGEKTAQIWFHLLLNVGRLLSYGLVGAAIGALGSAVFAGGELAGVGSGLRRAIAIFTGFLLIWFGLSQAKPGWLPTLPFLHPAKQQQIHEKLTLTMSKVSGQSRLLTPVLLGLLWGLIPCGFLYAGQLRAAETQSWLGGAAIMLAFGAGTLPAMVGMGAATSLLSGDRRSQLFRMGGWVTVVIGLLLLLRTGDTMSDYSGHGALVLLILTLIARPISRLWPALLNYRRGLGVGACLLSLLHLLHMASHTWSWNFRAVQFMLPSHQIGVWLGAIALLLMLPAALTSFDRAQKALGNRWRKIHLLGIPALLLAAAHTVMVGSSYWGTLALTWQNQLQAGLLGLAVAMVLAGRSRKIWTLLSLGKYYAPPKTKITNRLDTDADGGADDSCQHQLP
ncbi:MAG: ferric reductase [Leptolyngbya foveolarum]|uniref:Ferric reductase n=1 Tax=Leptolyngbya foveolarum TaxID=47253 RepID=A0A2W4TXP7_9CYAN|nr:MAG: ferric reductase [Leptolyngbya foveolarum]